MRIPPPLLFALTYLAGVSLQQLAPLALSSAVLAPMVRLAGIGLLSFGGGLALFCLGLFLRARTTVNPASKASTLVTRGPYRVTRNPMYVSLILTYAGLAMSLSQSWPLFLLPLPVIFLHKVVIPFEEMRLREAFGDAYEQYIVKVRRWV